MPGFFKHGGLVFAVLVSASAQDLINNLDK
jgi:hypothetical protein